MVNPFDRRAKQMELTRKGMSGEALHMEMKKWTDAKKAEWRMKGREKEKEREREKERNGGSSDARTSNGDGSAAKSGSETRRHAWTGATANSRGNDTKTRKVVWNGDWGMDVAKVSFAGSGMTGDKSRNVKVRERKESESGRDSRDLNAGRDTRESNANRDRREPDTGKDLTKSKPRFSL
jgi:hypothetical protein